MGRYERNARASCARDNVLHAGLVLIYLRMPCYLHVAVFPKDFFVPMQYFFCSRGRAVPYGMCVLAAVRGKYRDESFAKLLYKLAVDARAIVETFEMRL